VKTSIKTIGLLVVFAVGLTGPLFSQVPDLTKDTKTVDRELTYNLGATGLRGWIYTKAADNLDAAQGRTTLASRQIQRCPRLEVIKRHRKCVNASWLDPTGDGNRARQLPIV
jgi:hypothetical protein